MDKRVLLLVVCALTGLQVGHGDTNPQDAAALLSLMSQWKNTPASWGASNDPCGMSWDGVSCKNSRVVSLKLSSMGIQGKLSGDIGLLTELQSLDLSNNNELGGPLSPEVGNLKQLATLILTGCNFSGNIPTELGNLPKLSFLALNSNKFISEIPASLGSLSNLHWLDLADNQLSGALPISTANAPGLDQLFNTEHFHFNKNKLSGTIPEKLFSSNMSLIHLLLDGNEFTGQIPASLGLVQTLEVIRLDNNSLIGRVPANINNLTLAKEINLANNKLTGALPDLTGMTFLNHVDLSNNIFDPSETPPWFTELPSLTTLFIESGGIHGKVPETLFSFPQLEQVVLINNHFNGTLSLGDNISKKLKIVDFRNNALSSFTVTSKYNKSLILIGNPVCNTQLLNTVYCLSQKQKVSELYSTSISHCDNVSCQMGQSINPQSCACAYPYQGLMIFQSPLFQDVTNATLFQSLESSLWIELDLTPGSVFLNNPILNADSYVKLQVDLFPSGGMYFNRSEIQRIGFDLSNQKYKPPSMFGPYYFIAAPYLFPGRRSTVNKRLIIKVAVGCVILFMGAGGICIYANFTRKKARRSMKLSGPFASWISSSKKRNGAPQLKRTRWFSYDELKKSTNNFSKANEIGSGGSGLVYIGMLPSGQLVAIKRAEEGSIQIGLEFKTEIELLSRVHHKNLVGLVGFCSEQGKQMLVYEFIPNGTLRDNLNGNSGIQLDWKRRLRIALGSGRGLAYLHELADTPIIHRDIKSTNILLDENLKAKVVDFGISRLLDDSEKGYVSTQVKGTLGYLDPEYYMTQHLTEKSDVYSFGVLMLELITGRKPIERGKYIVSQVRMAVNKSDEEFYGLKEIIDPLILGTSKLIGFKRYVELAMRCVELSAADRPTMSEVVKEIEMILHIERLKAKSVSASSSATYFGNMNSILNNPCTDSIPRKDGKFCTFDCCGGYVG